MARSAIVIGMPSTCRRLERQLDLLGARPATLGWIVTRRSPGRRPADPVLGELDHLETIVAYRRPDLALVTLPAAMTDLIASVRTRLRRLGVPDRFMPTLEDQIEGVGPRSRFEVDPQALLGRPPRVVDGQAVAAVIRDRRVLITGAGGSIGSELARLACRFGAGELILLERSENALFEIDRQVARTAPGLPRCAVLHDVVDAPATAEHFRRLRPDIVFHAAAHKHVSMMEGHPAAAVDNNLFGTRSVADAAVASNAARFVLISTDKAVNPRSIMGATKRLAELYVHHVNRGSPTDCSIVRFGNVLGSTGSVLDIWAREIAEGGPLTVTDPRMTRYFMTIPEAAALVMQSAALPPAGSDAATVFLLDMGAPVGVLDLARRFAAMHGLTVTVPRQFGDAGEVETQPEIVTQRPRSSAGAIRVVFTGRRPGEKLHEELAARGEAIRATRHPDIKVWTGPPAGVPGESHIAEMLRNLAPGHRSTRPEVVAQAVRRAAWGRVEPLAA